MVVIVLFSFCKRLIPHWMKKIPGKTNGAAICISHMALNLAVVSRPLLETILNFLQKKKIVHESGRFVLLYCSIQGNDFQGILTAA